MFVIFLSPSFMTRLCFMTKLRTYTQNAHMYACLAISPTLPL